jgi:DNA-binding NarL/FixJ family response regulator
VVTESNIRLAILAAIPALRSGLRTMLAGGEHIEVLVEAASLAELLEGFELGDFDVLLVAGDEQALAGLPAALAAESLPPAVLLLNEQAEAARALPALGARAWGLLPPDCGEEELLAAVTAVHEGLLAGAPALIQPLLGPARLVEAGEELVEELTERELDVLQLLAQGLANKQIALELDISEHTVKFHSSAIYAKLGVTNRTEAVRRGARLGLVVL